MDNLSLFVNGLYNSLVDKLGSRFTGDFSSEDGMGYIEGLVDSKKIKFRIFKNVILFRLPCDISNLSQEITNIISEYVGFDEILKSDYHASYILNKIDTSIALKYNIEERNIKTK